MTLDGHRVVPGRLQDMKGPFKIDCVQCRTIGERLTANAAAVLAFEHQTQVGHEVYMHDSKGDHYRLFHPKSMEGTKYLDFILERERSSRQLRDEPNSQSVFLLGHLSSEQTKRILFDSSQASLFANLNDGPPIEVRAVFDRFYIEFTDGLIGTSPDGANEEVQGILIVTDALTPGNLPRWTVSVWSQYGAKQDRRVFWYKPQDGSAWLRTGTLRREGSELDGDGPMLARAGDSRVISSYERWYEQMAGLISWMSVYMVAKGIKVEALSLPRQQRRALERANKPLPHPWHIVKLDPGIIRLPEGDETTRVGSSHKFRYDVIGHLRFGRYRRGDGTYVEHVTWVPPHQRGLRHTLYIPKTYLVTR